MATQSTKVVRSYRLVFRRRWRIFRIGNWRLPLPGAELPGAEIVLHPRQAVVVVLA